MDGTEPSSETEEGGGLAASPFFALYKPTFALSALGVSGLALVEGIFVVHGEVEPIFVLMPLSGGAQSATGFCRHVYPDGSFALYFQQINSGTLFQSNTLRQRGLYLIGDRALAGVL